MSDFEFITQDVDTLAAFIFGVIDTTENDVIEYIENNTGITISKVNLAPEIRIKMIVQDLLKEHVPSQEADDATR